MNVWARVLRLWWIGPVGLFAILRLFGEGPVYIVKSDQCSYLILAQTFPFNTLYNGQLYLIHPPLWGWIVGVFHLALPLVWAGLAATQVFVLAYLLMAIRWGQRDHLGRAGLAVAILFLAVQAIAVGWDTQISRFPILVFITILALMVFENWLQRQSNSPPRTRRNAKTPGQEKPESRIPDMQSPVVTFPWLVLLINVLAFLISDQCLMILPCQLVIFALGGRWRRWRPVAALMALSAVAFLIWPAVRLGVYLTHDTYPAGINGTIEDVRNAPIKAIFQPNLLPHTLEHNSLYNAGEFHWSSLDWINLRQLWRIVGPRPYALTWAVLALVALAFVRAIRPSGGFVRLDWPDLAVSAKLLLISALLFVPAAAGLYPWYGMPALVPFALLLGRGFDTIRLLWPRADMPVAWLAALACVPVAAWWLDAPKTDVLMAPWSEVREGGSAFLYTRRPMYRARNLAERINRLPNDGGAIMAELSMEITVQTGRRAFDVPFDPAELWPIIEQYDVRYLVVDDNAFKRTRLSAPQARKVTRWDTYSVVANDPARFVRIDRIADDYDGYQLPDSFSLYQVIRP